MPLEIEVKIRVENLAVVRQTLQRTNATPAGKVLETNIFFDRPDRSLRAKDCGLRVRLTSSQGQPATVALLTYKGPKQATGMRSREAYDLHVSPVEQLIPLIEALGFQRTLSFEKHRESWTIDGCQVELDELPSLGTFVEVEGPSEERVKEVQEKIGLAGQPAVKPSYIAMVDEWLQQNGGGKDLQFPA